MADGSHMTWKHGTCEHLDLEAALSRLSAGEVKDGFCVELGNGHVARFDPGPLGERLVERLQVHSRLCALAGALPEPDVAKKLSVSVDVDPEVKALLDAVRRTR